jgi:hypothetical protein
MPVWNRVENVLFNIIASCVAFLKIQFYCSYYIFKKRSIMNSHQRSHNQSETAEDGKNSFVKTFLNLSEICGDICSLLIEKDGRAHRNILIKFPCVYVCLSYCDLFNFW